MKKSTFALMVGAVAIGAAPVSRAQQLPPIRQLGPVTHVSAEPLGAVTTVRHLPGGRVLVNDIIGRRVVMFDSSLATSTVIADTTSATANAYGVRPGGLIAYRADSTLFVDPASLSMLLIDPNGKIARVMSAPRANDVGFLVGGPFGSPAFDRQGRLIYRAPPRLDFGRRGGSGNRGPEIPSPPDSAALVRFDLATRKLDTVTFFKTPKISLAISQDRDGGMRVQSTINPLPQGDDWAVLNDGTIALVRGRDYHVDWLGPDGTFTPSPKIPFQWERLTDEAKVAFVDSARTAIEKARASGQFNFGGGMAGAFGLGGGVGRAGAEGGRRGEGRRGAGGDSSSAAATPPPAGTATPAAGSAAAAGATPQPGTMTVTTGGNTTVTAVGPGGAGISLGPINMVSPSELPDYKPAFTPGSTRADADGNLWVRTSQNVDGRPVYNVIDRKGVLVDRVQLPQNRVLVGFGPGGVVYLGVRDGTTAHLEVARVR
ncbi:MAG: hypothetical protein ABR585_11515 [Gemmatimonadaceae bacterium]